MPKTSKKGNFMQIIAAFAPKSLQRPKFGANQPEPQTKNTTATATNLNNIPSTQNQVIVAKSQPYKEIQTFEVPNVGKGKIYALQNGHRVVILPKKGSTNICTHVKVGGVDEPRKINGISHLVEHIVAPHQEFKDIGVISNAQTGKGDTSFYVQFVPENSEDFEKFVKIQSKIFDKKEIQDEVYSREKKVVAAEYSYRKMSNFQNVFEKTKQEQLFGEKGVYLYETLGTDKTIENITKHDVIEHYNKFYTPENSITTIVGDVDCDEAIKTISKHFNAPKKATGTWESNSAPDFSKPLQSPKRSDFVSPDKDKGLLANISFVGPVSSRKNLIMAEILCDVANQKPLKELSGKHDFRTGLSVGDTGIIGQSPLLLICNARWEEKDQDGANQLKTLYGGLFDVSQNPIDPQAFQRAKKTMLEISEDNENSLSLAKRLGSRLLVENNPNYLAENTQIINSIKKEDVEEFAKKYLDFNKASLIVTHPKPKEDKAQTTFGQSSQSRIEMSKIKQYELPNNLEITVNSSSEANKTLIDLQLESPKKFPDVKNGTGILLAFMLEKKDYDGFSIKFDAGNQGIMAYISADKNKSAAGLKAAKMRLLEPKFTEKDLEKAKKDTRFIAEVLTKPSTTSKKAQLLGEEDWGETLKNIDKITLKDVEALHKKILQNAQGQAIITAPTKEFEETQGSIFAELNKGFPPLQKHQKITPEKPKSIDKPYVLLQNSSGRTDQATIDKTFATPKMQNAKDIVAKWLLADLTRKKINDDLREKQGIIYAPEVNAEDEKISLFVNTEAAKDPENIKKTLDSFKRQTADLAAKPLSLKELERAKRLLKTDIFTNLEMAAGRQTELETAFESDYGVDFTNATLQAIDDVTPEHIQKMARLIYEKPSITSIVAPKKAIEANMDYLKGDGEICKIPQSVL